ncbi:hypothetical protein EVAR_2703_1 [Eumeta japonica]|uniref:Uncharacterized protein n=1 Tax=Eumeta variegata TaxID=151549 RepID=A0A4C1SMD6_EUMVA|nr:hypothetical protein EVAR_2703_1 [Eumeta japonica]
MMDRSTSHKDAHYTVRMKEWRLDLSFPSYLELTKKIAFILLFTIKASKHQRSALDIQLLEILCRERRHYFQSSYLIGNVVANGNIFRRLASGGAVHLQGEIIMVKNHK